MCARHSSNGVVYLWGCLGDVQGEVVDTTTEARPLEEADWVVG